jgi:hypothetical protein
MRLNFSRTENVLVTNIGELELIFRQISRENGAGGNNLAHDLRDQSFSFQWPSAEKRISFTSSSVLKGTDTLKECHIDIF